MLLDPLENRIARCPSLQLRGDLYLLASLIRQDQGRLDASSHHLRWALHAYTRAGDTTRLLHALLRCASFLRQTGRLTEAITVATQAAELSDADADRHTFLAVHHNLAAYLIDDGQWEAARARLLRIVPLYPTAPDSPGILQYRWLCARLASASGDLRGAIGTYEDLRDRFLAAGRGREAALIVLDMARFYLDLHDGARSREILLTLPSLLPPSSSDPASASCDGLLADVAAGQVPSRHLLHRLSSLLRPL
jgi:tetratricopeptide (TPR) repeat protein